MIMAEVKVSPSSLLPVQSPGLPDLAFSVSIQGTGRSLSVSRVKPFNKIVPKPLKASLTFPLIQGSDLQFFCKP